MLRIIKDSRGRDALRLCRYCQSIEIKFGILSCYTEEMNVQIRVQIKEDFPPYHKVYSRPINPQLYAHTALRPTYDVSVFLFIHQKNIRMNELT